MAMISWQMAHLLTSSIAIVEPRTAWNSLELESVLFGELLTLHDHHSSARYHTPTQHVTTTYNNTHQL